MTRTCTVELKSGATVILGVTPIYRDSEGIFSDFPRCNETQSRGDVLPNAPRFRRTSPRIPRTTPAEPTQTSM